jgi:hypothetical protein
MEDTNIKGLFVTMTWVVAVKLRLALSGDGESLFEFILASSWQLKVAVQCTQEELVTVQQRPKPAQLQSSGDVTRDDRLTKIDDDDVAQSFPRRSSGVTVFAPGTPRENAVNCAMASAREENTV